MISLATQTHIQSTHQVQLATEIEKERHAEEERAAGIRLESGQVIYGIINPHSETLTLSGFPYFFNYYNI